MLLLFEGEPGPTNTLKFVAEKLAVGLWTFDIQSNAMRWSSGMFHLLGHEPGTVEPSLELFSAAVHPSDRLKTCAYDAMIQGGAKMDRQFRLVSSDGRMRWVCNRGEVIRDANGQARKAVGVVFDVTRQQEARLAQRIAEDRYRALSEALSAIVWAAPGDGRISEIPQWRDLTDQSEEEMRSVGWLAAVHEQDREAVSQSWQRAIATATRFNEQFRVRARDGGYNWVNCRAMPILRKDGAIREWVMVLLNNLEDTAATPAGGDVITGAQLRAARAIVNWSVKDVAEAAKVSVSTVRRLEEHDGPSNMRPDSIGSVRKALEMAGVEFLFLQSGKPGVRPRS